MGQLVPLRRGDRLEEQQEGGGRGGRWASGLAGVGVGALAADAVALVFASALFGAVHALWVADGAEDGDGGGGDKLEWFLETGAWGLLYGSVFVLGGHNLAAPLLAHAAQNTWWCCEDARAMGIEFKWSMRASVPSQRRLHT